MAWEPCWHASTAELIDISDGHTWPRFLRANTLRWQRGSLISFGNFGGWDKRSIFYWEMVWGQSV